MANHPTEPHRRPPDDWPPAPPRDRVGSGGGPRRPIGRIVLSLVLIGAGLVLIVTLGVQSERSAEVPAAVPTLRPEPGSVVPRPAVAAPEDRPNTSDVAELDAWSQRVAEVTDLPARVLAAYGRAEMWMRSQRPDCRLSWATIAGIARVESRHGNFGGAQVGVDGVVSKPIIGPALDGSSGVRTIPDTDSGTLDGDTTWDRAVGPLQFLPTTWNRWAASAGGDGARPDPQNIDDAALTSARYLCSADDDMSTPVGWWEDRKSVV